MCEDCRQIRDEGKAYATEMQEWVQAQTDLPDPPDGLGKFAATSAGAIAQNIPGPAGQAAGDLVIVLAHTAFDAGVRAVRDEAANGEGATAPVIIKALPA